MENEFVIGKKSETICADGNTLVKILLTRYQGRGLATVVHRTGLNYHSVVQLAICEYLDNHLTDSDKHFAMNRSTYEPDALK